MSPPLCFSVGGIPVSWPGRSGGGHGKGLQHALAEAILRRKRFTACVEAPVFATRRPQTLAAEVPAAAELFKKASTILGYDLLQVCTEGPKEKLDSTVVRAPGRLGSGDPPRRCALDPRPRPSALALPMRHSFRAGEPASDLRRLACCSREAEGAHIYSGGRVLNQECGRNKMLIPKPAADDS